jgi:NADH-quinone oxidoreductase subunit G
VQRLRPAIGHPGATRSEWQVIADLARRVDRDLGVLTGPMASAQLFAAVPFLNGLTLEELAGTGVRWPEREQATAFPAGASAPFELERPPPAPEANGALRLGHYRSIWASRAVEASPALKFLHPEEQRVELSPEDAVRLGIENGDPVEVRGAPTGDSRLVGTRVRGTAVLRGAVPAGSAFLEETATAQSANALTESLVEVRRA